jgi:hypothetical protein
MYDGIRAEVADTTFIVTARNSGVAGKYKIMDAL